MACSTGTDSHLTMYVPTVLSEMTSPVFRNSTVFSHRSSAWNHHIYPVFLLLQIHAFFCIRSTRWSHARYPERETPKISTFRRRKTASTFCLPSSQTLEINGFRHFPRMLIFFFNKIFFFFFGGGFLLFRWYYQNPNGISPDSRKSFSHFVVCCIRCQDFLHIHVPEIFMILMYWIASSLNCLSCSLPYEILLQHVSIVPCLCVLEFLILACTIYILAPE